MKFFLLAALFLAQAEAHANAYVYELKNLSAGVASLYNTSYSQRHFLRFRNEQGVHTIIYEESPNEAPLKDVGHLLSAMKLGTCTIELECKTKAFCTGGDCRSMYYEMTNAPLDLKFAPRDRCKLRSYSCSTGQ